MKKKESTTDIDQDAERDETIGDQKTNINAGHDHLKHGKGAVMIGKGRDAEGHPRQGDPEMLHHSGKESTHTSKAASKNIKTSTFRLQLRTSTKV